MKKITGTDMVRLGKLEGKTIYREKSNCEYYELTMWNEIRNTYTGETEDGIEEEFTPSDLIGDYMV